MIACIIEFGVRSGMEEEHQKALLPLLKEVENVDGFISKETFESRNNPGKVITVSYWHDRNSLQAWMRNPSHRASITVGRKIFTYYDIKVGEIYHTREWHAV